VSAFATDPKLVLGQEAVAEKANEIVALPKLLEQLDLEGALVSIDAMGCNPTIRASDPQRRGRISPECEESRPNISKAVGHVHAPRRRTMSSWRRGSCRWRREQL
jgi:predicted transposase YbfD/YdcC